MRCKLVIDLKTGEFQVAVTDGATRAEAAATLTELMNRLGAAGVPVDNRGELEFHRGSPDHVHLEANVHE